jgi:hypothetical protein
MASHTPREREPCGHHQKYGKEMKKSPAQARARPCQATGPRSENPTATKKNKRKNEPAAEEDKAVPRDRPEKRKPHNSQKNYREKQKT